MKKEILVLAVMIVMIVIVGFGYTADKQETVSPNYNHLQEQKTDSGFDSPVINSTLNQVKDVIVG